MKKIIYVCLSAILAVSFGCEKDDLRNSNEGLQISEETHKGGNLKNSIDWTETIVDLDNVTQFLIEWDPASTLFERAIIRQRETNLGYLISWENCTSITLNTASEVWHVNPYGPALTRPIKRPDTGGQNGRYTIDGTCN